MIKVNIVNIKNAYEWGWPWTWDEVLDSMEFQYCFTRFDGPVTEWVNQKLEEYNKKYDLVDYENIPYDLQLELVYYDNPWREIYRTTLVEAYYNK